MQGLMQGFWKKLTAAGLLVAGGVAVLAVARPAPETTLAQPAEPAAPTAAAPVESQVHALGRVEPAGEVIRLAPSPASGTTRIGRLLVREGDALRPGQPVAELDTYATRRAALAQAEAGVHAARTRLAQVEAGAKAGDLAAQRATITRLEAELAIAEREYRRFAALEREGAISSSDLDRKLLTRDSTAEQLRQARATFESVAEVRPTDVSAARADVRTAEAALLQARAALDLALVRAPRDGRVLKIYAWPGETVGTDGLLDLGATAQMYVVAEVYESDVRRLHRGQPVRIASAALGRDLNGAVERVGLMVRKQDVLDTDPAADVDSRVVEVHVRVDPLDSPQLAALSNLEVRVAFLP